MNFTEPGQVRVKICGLTNEADARMSIDAGADALGFNFFQGSSRCVDPDTAIPWIRKLGAAAARVAVVVNPDEGLLVKLRDAGCFELIQFHGDESPEFCARAGFARWIKAIRVKDDAALYASLKYPTTHLLLDAWSGAAYGGTGKRLDWDLVRDFLLEHKDRQFILAGGLNVQNVRQAIRISRPHAVDVASGVELVPGKKEEYLVREFIHAVREFHPKSEDLPHPPRPA